ncbi:helix-turn-helix domain-containing protein [Megasphaera massiliensis]|uniref:helix-turn-helix domain-containing protein n=1 Tax=Megasphaera massiliensis TaxID=1232428 RepID=UPI0026EE92C4|nr:helix-turn-helix transcriptional regulator [Megasphaera massiliensis]
MKKTILSEEDPAKEIGKTLKKIRFDRELTLDNVSMMTGVSKTMLGQIERGTSVPTVGFHTPNDGVHDDDNQQYDRHGDPKSHIDAE